MKPELELFVSGLITGALIAFIIFVTRIHIVDGECEKELISRDEPRGIVCVTKIQSIVINEGDDRND